MHPVAIQPRAQHAEIFLAERLQRLECDVLGTLQIEHACVGFDDRRINVVIAQLADAQHLTAQLQIAMEGRQPGVHLIHQLRIDFRRQAAAEHRRFEHAIELARPRVEHRALHLRVQRRAHAVLILLPRAPERIEDQLAVAAIDQLPPARIARLIDFQFASIRQLDRRPRNTGIGIERVDLLWLAQREARPGQQRFTIGIQRMRRHPHGVAQHEAVRREALLLLQESLDPRRANRQQLGVHPRRGLAHRRQQGLHAAMLRLRLRHALVLVALQARIHIDAISVLHRLRDIAIDGEHRRGIPAKRPLVTRQPLDALLCGRKCRLPGGVIRIKIGEIPLIANSFGACRQTGGAFRRRQHRPRGASRHQYRARHHQRLQPDHTIILSWELFTGEQGQTSAALKTPKERRAGRHTPKRKEGGCRLPRPAR